MGILSKDTEALLIRQASRLGETPDSLVRRLVADAAAPPPRRRRPDPEALREVARQVAALPLLDDRPAREIRDELWER
jgi:hypothetical protein